MKWREQQESAREYFAALLAKHCGSVRAIAEETGLHRGYLYRRLKQLGLWTPKRPAGNEQWRALA